MDVQLDMFVAFADKAGDRADDVAVVTGSNVVSAGFNRVGGNRAGFTFARRTADAKAVNNVTRAAFLRSLFSRYDGLRGELDSISAAERDAVKAFLNSDNNAENNSCVPSEVLDILTKKVGGGNDGISRKDFNCGKPLTVRRIKRIVEKLDRLYAGKKATSETVGANKCNAKAVKALSEQACSRLQAKDINGFLSKASFALASVGEDCDDVVNCLYRECTSCYRKGILSRDDLNEIGRFVKDVKPHDSDRRGFDVLRLKLKAYAMFKEKSPHSDDLKFTHLPKWANDDTLPWEMYWTTCDMQSDALKSFLANEAIDPSVKRGFVINAMKYFGGALNERDSLGLGVSQFDESLGAIIKDIQVHSGNERLREIATDYAAFEKEMKNRAFGVKDENKARFLADIFKNPEPNDKTVDALREEFERKYGDVDASLFKDLYKEYVRAKGRTCFADSEKDRLFRAVRFKREAANIGKENGLTEYRIYMDAISVPIDHFESDDILEAKIKGIEALGEQASIIEAELSDIRDEAKAEAKNAD